MTNLWVLFGVAILGGVAVVLQSQFMGTLNEKLGVVTSVFVTYGSGGLLIVFWLLLQRGGQWAGAASVPWYTWSTGLLGLFIVGSIAYATPRLGLVVTFTVMLASQFLLAAVLDHNGWLGAAVRPVDWSRIGGLIVMLIGVWLTVR